MSYIYRDAVKVRFGTYSGPPEQYITFIIKLLSVQNL